MCSLASTKVRIPVHPLAVSVNLREVGTNALAMACPGCIATASVSRPQAVRSTCRLRECMAAARASLNPSHGHMTDEPTEL